MTIATSPTLTCPCRIAGIRDETYHADALGFAEPSLSASIATKLVSRSPYHAWLAHPRLGGKPSTPTEQMERGTLLHALVFGTPPPVVVVDAADFKGKAAQAERDAARAEGKIPLVTAKWAEIQAQADRICEGLLRKGILLGGGASEEVFLWEEDSAFGPVLCRGRLDHHFLPVDVALVYDLKTTENANPDDCARSLYNYGYDVQWAAYTSAVRALRPDLADQVEMRFLFAEVETGVVVQIAPDIKFQDLGMRRWRRAVETWARCLYQDEWPDYGSQVIEVTAPAWALSREDRIEEEEGI